MSKILLIEDMKGVRDSLSLILSMAGHSVVQAVDGNEGINKLKSDNFDLIITDILMPEKDGTEVIIESKKTNPNCPIMAISAGGNGIPADEALGIAAHKADAILEKPFSKDDLLNKIKELID
ncbi:response regulator transcription factor [Curvivirga aplysinae]|uniref:response regulator transcription factor n=1 Tax=Curvivirga aplysinae TaxID=2529852 RepID=UPI0012BBBA02|nr:response regulator [Curvivirga aplysinae]MTI08958.1 response regulator [Curvivirga aplysinae]